MDVFIELLFGSLFGLNTVVVDNNLYDDDNPFLDDDGDDVMDVEVCDESESVDS